MNISGVVLFDPTSSANRNNANNSPITGVPVALQEEGDRSVRGEVTGLGVVAVTAANGTFTFTDVPAGTYRIVEAWGQAGAAGSTVSYNNASNITVTPEDPPFTEIRFVPATTNRINSLSPNTVFVTVADADITDVYFLDAPNHEEPLSLDQYVTIGDNLITGGDNGTVGFLPNGTPVQTSPATEPYPIPSAFEYQQYGGEYIPYDGYYSVSNTIVNSNFSGAWFNLSDHTTGDETGRMLIINGNFPGEAFFTVPIMVQPNTNYVFSTWICNVDSVIGEAPPELQVTVESTGGEILFNQNLTGDLNTTPIPTWRQIGDVVNTGDNDSIILTFISVGPAEYGNDFIIDDISFYQLQEAPVTEFVKESDTAVALPGSVITYTLNFTNDGPSLVSSAVFADPVPENTTIVPGSLTVNGVPYDESGIGTGLDLGDIEVGETVTITYQVQVDANAPQGEVISNTGEITYEFTDELGNPQEVTTPSNEVTTVITPDCACPTGPTGPTGPIGTPGPTGPTGPTGPAGSGSSQTVEHAHIVTIQTYQVPGNDLLPLNSNMTIGGTSIEHAEGDRLIALAAGTYLVNYRATVSRHCNCCCNCQGGNEIRIDMLVDRRYQPGTAARSSCSGGMPVDVCGTAILTLTEDSTAALVNNSGSPVEVSDTSVTIVRIQ